MKMKKLLEIKFLFQSPNHILKYLFVTITTVTQVTTLTNIKEKIKYNKIKQRNSKHQAVYIEKEKSYPS